MGTKTKNNVDDLTLVDAIETLSSIAELGADKGVGIVEEKELVMKDKKIPYHSVRWLHNAGGEATLGVVRDIFRVILDYLKSFYEKSYVKVKDEQTAERIRTIMVLVGEAAKNLDKYGYLFAQSHQPSSVTELNEFKQLQSYYLSKVAPKIDEGHLGKWVLALSGQQLRKSPIRLRHVPKNITTKHVYVDLDAVKRDTEYELFFMRKEDGTRFFNPRLIRNLKLVFDVGNYFRAVEKNDPLKRLDVWMDKFIQSCASDMVEALRTKLDNFFREAMRYKGRPLVEDLTKTCMALLLSASPKHLLSNHPSKSCLAYFEDFHLFLKEVLHAKEFQKILTTPVPAGNSNKINAAIKETTLGICRALFLHAKGLKALKNNITDLLRRAEKEMPQQKAVLSHCQSLTHCYEAVKHILNKHAHGPLNRMLDLLLSGEIREFDPMEQLNIASPQFALFFGDKRLIYTRLPSPTHQEYIHRAFINEEFKNYLISCQNGHGVKKHLCIVMQDRTTWKDAARCHAIEGLLHHKEYSPYLEVATYSIDTDFYQQRGHYNKDETAENFKRHLVEQMEDIHSGYFFSPNVQHELYKEFLPNLVNAVHQIYFEKAPKLKREQRHAFIDLVHLFTALKIAELTKADALSFCCKDGIDTGVAMSALLYAFFTWQLDQHKGSEEELKLLLFSPSLMWRERSMLPERFFRLSNVLHVLEETMQKLGSEPYRQQLQKSMSGLFSIPIWKAEVS